MGRRVTTRVHDGGLRLPKGILTRGQDEWWVERRDGVVVLIPRTADLSRLYINSTEQSLLDIWTGEDYCRFRGEVASIRISSCPDCDLRESCDLRARNEACWGCRPSCADCLYAQDIVRCSGAGR